MALLEVMDVYFLDCGDGFIKLHVLNMHSLYVS